MHITGGVRLDIAELICSLWLMELVNWLMTSDLIDCFSVSSVFFAVRQYGRVRASAQKVFFFQKTVPRTYVRPKENFSSEKKVLERGLEPRTLGLLDPRSNQLSYTSSDVSKIIRARNCTSLRAYVRMRSSPNRYKLNP